MQIWVDVDSCPNVIKDILINAARDSRAIVMLLSSKKIDILPGDYIKTLELVDSYCYTSVEIAQRAKVGDLVVTDEVSLATQILDKGAKALGYKGEKYTQAQIDEKLALNQFMENMQSCGAEIGNQPRFTQADQQSFTESLDSILIGY